MVDGNTTEALLRVEVSERAPLGIDGQFGQINEYIDSLRHPERDENKEVERSHIVDFDDDDRDVQFISPFQRVASISIELPGSESHNFFVDAGQKTIRRTIWSAGRILQSDVVISQGAALIAKREYPSTDTRPIADSQVLSAEEAQQLITVAHTALSGLRRVLG